jgi:hypothetical protein
MLRHIISVSLAMAACATLIPTRANAASLTVTPIGEIPARPGDSIEFRFTLTPARSSVVTITGLILGIDPSELSVRTGGIPLPITVINTPITFTSRHTVLTPVKDGIRDIWATVFYNESGPLPITGGQAYAEAGVAPVPEPLTMFGAVTALGYGVILKRKSSKKTVS